jgi:fatty acid/phospholipid biosynthesis enzyme
VYADVVRELRESKMALAILTMERDELQQSVRNGNSGNVIASRNLL